MTRRGSLIAVLVLCTVSLLALDITAASAATLYKCTLVAEGAGAYLDSHCHESQPNGDYETQAITESSGTEGTPFSVGATRIGSTIGGIKFETSCATLNGSGQGENVEIGGEMRFEGFNLQAEFSGCVVTNPEPTKCKVSGGKITTVAMKSTTIEKGSEISVKISPESSTTFTTITLEGCGTKAFNGSKTVSGSILGVVPNADPGLLTFTGTAGGELKFGGQVATFEGSGRSVMKGTEETLALRP